MGMIEELKSLKWGIELDSDFLMGIIEEFEFEMGDRIG